MFLLRLHRSRVIDDSFDSKPFHGHPERLSNSISRLSSNATGVELIINVRSRPHWLRLPGGSCNGKISTIGDHRTANSDNMRQIFLLSFFPTNRHRTSKVDSSTHRGLVDNLIRPGRGSQPMSLYHKTWSLSRQTCRWVGILKGLQTLSNRFAFRFTPEHHHLHSRFQSLRLSP